ncbi:MAG: methyltransferase domain-containing protein [Planctomycetes bacterium]|nr:methyltransferase domain-containing protein [Planctomycetota bacterium]
MDRNYWDMAAQDYDRQILDSLNTDLRGVIPRRLDELSDARHTACDFGCGVGHYLPSLAARFKRVIGIDLSPKLLKIASERCGHLNNVELVVGDLARTRRRLPKVHLAVCTNVLIAPALHKSRAILGNIHRHVVRGGRLMLLVPSLESALWANLRLIEWNQRCGQSLAAARREAIKPDYAALEGVIDREEVPHRHYLREQIIAMLDEAGFVTERTDKAEYPWDTEFEHPPGWMKEPYPWDWLIIARKR